jgi:hypothetical protein
LKTPRGGKQKTRKRREEKIIIKKGRYKVPCSLQASKQRGILAEREWAAFKYVSRTPKNGA